MFCACECTGPHRRGPSVPAEGPGADLKSETLHEWVDVRVGFDWNGPAKPGRFTCQCPSMNASRTSGTTPRSAGVRPDIDEQSAGSKAGAARNPAHEVDGARTTR